MSFIDQILAARLFGGNSRGTTPPINPSPNVNTIRDGGYGAASQPPPIMSSRAGAPLLNTPGIADPYNIPYNIDTSTDYVAPIEYHKWYEGKPGVTKDLLNAISGHEVEGQRARGDDIWIRTTANPKDSENLEYKKKGSTAYGPLQITKSTLTDVDTKKLSAAEQKTYDKLMLQGKLFARFGNEGPGSKGYKKRGNKVPKPYTDPKTGKVYNYSKRWDYGGLGATLNKEEKKHYWEFGKKILEKKAGYMKKGNRLPRKYDIEDMTPADIARLARAWRGEAKGFGTTTASEYEKNVMKRYKNRAKLRKK
jgi:hypothetical protein